MKKYISTIFLVFTVLISLLSACEKLDLAADIHSCIEEKIKEIKKEELRNPPAQVWKWEVDGDTYYYFTSDCCDQYNYLYDSDCNVVCAPDGGFTGTGDGNCPNFNGQIVKTLVWEDDRAN
ncbi:MAG: hypothetical protein PF484_09995 [Bacteroidales bacterium]|jgi:hypothetical protein|nr:hypothetical protein [Bacteroidales bacterium]